MQPKPSRPLFYSYPGQLPGVWLLLIGGLIAMWIWLGFFAPGRAAQPAQIAAQDVVALQPFSAGPVPSEPQGQPAGVSPLESGDALPLAKLDEDFFDFGRIAAEDLVTREFYLTNNGDDWLRVQRAYTTCSCTTAEISSALVPPGKSARITIAFDPRVHNVAGTTVRRGLILETNDPLQPVLEIWVQASVRAE